MKIAAKISLSFLAMSIIITIAIGSILYIVVKNSLPVFLAMVTSSGGVN
jgi:hypothetical protein